MSYVSLYLLQNVDDYVNIKKKKKAYNTSELDKHFTIFLSTIFSLYRDSFEKFKM